MTLVRQPIADSWRRTALHGLDPGTAPVSQSPVDVDLRSRLLHAAEPVLDDLDAQLEGTRFTTLLVDRDGRIVRRWAGHRGTRRALDGLGVDVGSSLLEEIVGTTAPGVVIETRRSIAVNGAEHFALPFKEFSCYAHPIVHPTTHRIEGVLDVTTRADEASVLLPPLVARAAADIEQRLLDGSRCGDRELLDAFRAAGGRRRALVAVGHDLVLSNQQAQDLLGSTDLAQLRTLALDVGDGAVVDMTLESRLEVRVHTTRVGGVRGGVLLDVKPRETPPPSRPASPPSRVRASAAVDPPVLVCGPPGCGRSTRARELAGDQPLTALTSAEALLDPQAWVRRFGAAVRRNWGVVCVDGIELLPPALVDLVSAHVAARRRPRVVLVAGEALDLAGPSAALAAQAVRREELAPLAHRLHELRDVVARMLRERGADPSLHLTPGALRALSHQPWPGNLRELGAVVDHVLVQRATGGVVVDDLPEGYRSAMPDRPITTIERAERDAILAALREHGGNKSRAATALGISRTTLYAKVRTLRITG